VNYVGAIAIVVWMIALVGMVYGPLAAFLVEMFPAKIRATSLSLPYHLGVGVLGGFLPFAASALVIYYGKRFRGSLVSCRDCCHDRYCWSDLPT
jgi:hypothetical protein